MKNTVLGLWLNAEVGLGHVPVDYPYQEVNFLNRKINLNVIVKCWWKKWLKYSVFSFGRQTFLGDKLWSGKCFK